MNYKMIENEHFEIDVTFQQNCLLLTFTDLVFLLLNPLWSNAFEHKNWASYLVYTIIQYIPVPDVGPLPEKNQSRIQ